MAFLKANLVIFMLIMAVCGVSKAAVYEVGGSTGWTSTGDVDYQNWAANNNFHIGDILVFNYNSQFHNVKQVKHQDYESCNAISPIATFINGSDIVTLEKEGHLYFICGYPGHCQLGQKVDILVTSSFPSPSPSVSALGLSPLASAASCHSFSGIHLAFVVLPWIFI